MLRRFKTCLHERITERTFGMKQVLTTLCMRTTKLQFMRSFRDIQYVVLILLTLWDRRVRHGKDYSLLDFFEHFLLRVFMVTSKLAVCIRYLEAQGATYLAKSR